MKKVYARDETNVRSRAYTAQVGRGEIYVVYGDEKIDPLALHCPAMRTDCLYFMVGK